MIHSPSPVKVRSFAVSDVGSRANNEDAYLINEAHGLFVVADGLGGLEKGEVASWFGVTELNRLVATSLPSLAETTLEPLFDDMPENTPEDQLEYALLSIHRRLYELNLQASASAEASGVLATRKKKMATTLVAALFRGNKAYVTNIGDSRAYRIRADAPLELITHDHSIVGNRIRSGELTKASALLAPQRNVITRSLGVKPKVDVDIDVMTVYPGERFLLCTDGLTGVVSDEEIYRFAAAPDTAAACHHLVDLAKQKGSQDNITVVLVEVLDALQEPLSSDRSEDTLF